MHSVNDKLDQGLILDAKYVTEMAAIACVKWIGKGDEISADREAVNSMRENLNKLNIAGTVVIGEGERDKAPMLFIGETVGNGYGVNLDIALDPLEGTTICAQENRNALSVMAFANKGGFLNAPDVYMEKIAVGGGLPENIIDLDDSPKQNLLNLAKAKKCDITDLQVAVLKRDRHHELISKIREAGARIKLISDGDIAAVISTCFSKTKIDMYIGTGGAPEGVLAAAALRTTEGQMMGRLLFSTNQERERAIKMGIKDINKKYLCGEMARGDVIFSASGVTNGDFLKGVYKNSQGNIVTNSLLMFSQTKTMHNIVTTHYDK